MSKICPVCNKEYSDELNFCPKDGSHLDVKQQQIAQFGLNLGDANAISGGINMSDNHSINTTSNIDSHNVITNNITQIERDKTPEELKHEKELAYRKACVEVYGNGLMTSEKTRKLEDIRTDLGLDRNSAKRILLEVQQRSHPISSELPNFHKTTLEKVKTAINNNNIDCVNRYLPQMRVLEQRYSVEDVHFTYHMIQAVLHPEECIKEYEKSHIDNYWQSFWTAIAYRKMGNLDKSALLSDDVLTKWTDFPQDNISALFATNALIDNDINTAKSYLDEIGGEFSENLYNLITCISAILYAETVSLDEKKQWQKDTSFYSTNLFADIDTRIKLKREQEEAETKRQEEEKRLREEAEAKRIAEEKRLQEEAEAKRKAEEKRLQDKAEEKRIAEEKRSQEEAEEKRQAEDRKKQFSQIQIEEIDIQNLSSFKDKFGYLRKLSDSEIVELKHILLSAPSDDNEAKFILGQLYLQESESAINHKLAYDAIKSASRHGVYEAGAFMAYFYLYGKVVEQDLEEAERRMKIDDDYKKNPIYVRMLVDLYTQKGNTMLAEVWKTKLAKLKN